MAKNGKWDTFNLWVLLILVAIVQPGCDSRSRQVSREIYYPVIKVVDGDTFRVLYLKGVEEKVRLIGIDAPEAKSVFKKKKHPFGAESTRFLKQMIENKTVRLEFDVARRDQYGRLLAYVFLEDGTFVNEELVRHGYASIMTVPPNVKYADRFYQLQTQARRNNAGYWSEYGNDIQADNQTGD